MEIAFKIKGDVGTEDRFSFRRWFETWIEAVNSGNLDLWQSSLADSVCITDLQEQDLDKNEFIKYLTSGKTELLVPQVTLSFEDGLVNLKGEWEVLQNNMVVFNGLFEMLVRKIEDGTYNIFGITFFPRLRLNVISNNK